MITTAWAPICYGQAYACIRYINGASEILGGCPKGIPGRLFATRRECEQECEALNKSLDLRKRSA